MTTQEKNGFGSFSTGFSALDKPLGGGIPIGSLTLIDGQSKAGKSILCQQLSYGALDADVAVAYYTTEYTVAGLVEQMQSVQFDIADDFLIDQFRIYPLVMSGDPDLDTAFNRISSHLQSLPGSFKFIIVDTVTDIVAHSTTDSIIGFFQLCKRICEQGRAICLVSHSYAFDEAILRRMRLLCDGHLSLSLEQVGGRLAMTLEISKIRNAEQTRDNSVSFVVDQRVGLKLLPFTKARV